MDTLRDKRLLEKLWQEKRPERFGNEQGLASSLNRRLPALPGSLQAGVQRPIDAGGDIFMMSAGLEVEGLGRLRAERACVQRRPGGEFAEKTQIGWINGGLLVSAVGVGIRDAGLSNRS